MTTYVTKTTARPAWAAGLTDKEWLFVAEYVNDLRATDAAERAGLANTRKSCREVAHRYRRRPHVADAIARLIEERNGASKLRVVEEINRLAFSTISDVLEIKDGQLVVRDHASLTEDQLAAVQSIEEVINEKGFRTLRVKQHDKLAALSLLAKVLGMLTNKTEISGPGGQPMALTLEASTARERIGAKLGAIASRRAAERQMIDVTPVRAAPSAGPARAYPTAGECEGAERE